MNQLFWIHELKKPTVVGAYVHVEQGDICWYYHTWEGQHVLQADGSTLLMPVQIEPYWTCTIRTDKYLYRSESNAKTALEAFKQVKAEYRKYSR